MAGVLPGPARDADVRADDRAHRAACGRDFLPAGDAQAVARARSVDLRDVWAPLVLFVFVIGGLYGGFFTPTEAGGVGASGAFLLGVLRGKLDRAEDRARRCCRRRAPRPRCSPC